MISFASPYVQIIYHAVSLLGMPIGFSLVLNNLGTRTPADDLWGRVGRKSAHA